MERPFTREEMLGYIDQVRKHFVEEKNPPSVEKETGHCMYNGPNGEHCAFAVLVPEAMRPLLTRVEDSNILIALKKCPGIKEHFGLEAEENDIKASSHVFLCDLQACHDEAADEINDSFLEEIKSNLDSLTVLVERGVFDSYIAKRYIINGSSVTVFERN